MQKCERRSSAIKIPQRNHDDGGWGVGEAKEAAREQTRARGGVKQPVGSRRTRLPIEREEDRILYHGLNEVCDEALKHLSGTWGIRTDDCIGHGQLENELEFRRVFAAINESTILK